VTSGWFISFRRNCQLPAKSSTSTYIRICIYIYINTHILISNNGLAALPLTKLNLELWHQRLGHRSMQSVKALLKIHHQQANMKDMKMSDIDDIQPETDLEPRTEKTQEEEEDQNTELCSTCVKTKIRRKIIRKPAERSKQPFELIHSALCGPITPASKGGARYFILYIDDFSRTCNVYFLRTKTAEELVSTFQQFTKYIATQFPGYPIRPFRCDNGKGEYDNQLFRGILSSSGISFEPSPPYTQHKNGVSERMIATITTKARAMMIDSCLEDSLWSEAVNTAVYLHALCPSRALEGKTPHEVLHGKRGDIGHRRRFGCIAHKLIPKEVRNGKFSPRSIECVMLGYTNSTKIWRLWDLQTGDTDSSTRHRIGRRVTGRVLNASDVIFDETKIGGKRSPETEVLTEVLRAILPDTDTEVAEHKDPCPSDELVNKELIQEDQEAPRSGIEELAAPRSGQECSSGSIQGIDQRPHKHTVILTPAPTPALPQLRRSRRLGGMNRVMSDSSDFLS
jgi:hypothetical protein